MIEKKTTGTFDTIALKQQAQSEIYEETKHMTAPELITYFRERSKIGSFAELWQKLQGQLKPSDSDL